MLGPHLQFVHNLGAFVTAQLIPHDLCTPKLLPTLGADLSLSNCPPISIVWWVSIVLESPLVVGSLVVTAEKLCDGDGDKLAPQAIGFTPYFKIEIHNLTKLVIVFVCCFSIKVQKGAERGHITGDCYSKETSRWAYPSEAELLHTCDTLFLELYPLLAIV